MEEVMKVIVVHLFYVIAIIGPIIGVVLEFDSILKKCLLNEESIRITILGLDFILAGLMFLVIALVLG